MSARADAMTGVRARRPPLGRAAAAIEVVLFVGSILLFMWVVQPATGLAVHVACYLLLLGFACASALAHGDTARAIGFWFDNFTPAARVLLPATIGLCVGVVAVGWLLGRSPEPGRALGIMPAYFGWALVQQFALQGMVQRRLWDAGAGANAPLVAAVIFALAHLPNPGLFVLTFAGGWMWAACYRRFPNLLVLALSNAVLAAVIVTSLPPAVTGDLRVGPGYWHHASREQGR